MAEVLRRQINQKHGTNLSRTAFDKIFEKLTVSSEDYHDLHRYSVDNYGFWLDLCEYLRIIFSVPPTPVRPVISSQHVYSTS